MAATTTTITLYLVPGSSSVFPHILLNYAEIDFTGRIMRPDDPEYASINPKRQVPALAIGDYIVTENPAIAHAINRLRPDKQIMGSTDIEFAKVCEWLNWLSATVHAQTWSAYQRPFRFTTESSGESGVKAAAEKKMLEYFTTINDTVHQTGPWTLGEQFTAVDAYLLPFWTWGQRFLGLDMDVKYPNWSRVMKALHGLEATQTTFAKEQQMLKDKASETTSE